MRWPWQKSAADTELLDRLEFVPRETGDQIWLTAMLDGRKIGHIEVTVQGDYRTAVIGSVRVEDEYRRRGVATRLLEELKALYPDLAIQHSKTLSDDGRAWSDFVGGLAGDLPEGIDFDLEQYDDEEMDIHTDSIVARIDGVIAGVVIFANDPDQVRILNLSVDDEWQRMGLATELMRQVYDRYPDKTVLHGPFLPEGRLWFDHVRDQLPAERTRVAAVQTLTEMLEPLRPQFAEAAQAVYDEWEQDENGEDVEFGTGGICDAITSALSYVVNSHWDVETHEASQPGDEHSYLAVVDRDAGAVVGVDIPYQFYESGGGYNWTKTPGVVFTPDMVQIFELDIDPDEYDADEWDGYDYSADTPDEGPDAWFDRTAKVPDFLWQTPSGRSGYTNKAWLSPEGEFFHVEIDHNLSLPEGYEDFHSVAEAGWARVYVGFRSQSSEVGVEYRGSLTSSQKAALRELVRECGGELEVIVQGPNGEGGIFRSAPEFLQWSRAAATGVEYYHGTVADLQPGDYILPANEGYGQTFNNGISDPAYAYATTDIGDAERYAEFAFNAAPYDEAGDPNQHVYRVVPLGEVERDPNIDPIPGIDSRNQGLRANPSDVRCAEGWEVVEDVTPEHLREWWREASVRTADDWVPGEPVDRYPPMEEDEDIEEWPLPPDRSALWWHDIDPNDPAYGRGCECFDRRLAVDADNSNLVGWINCDNTGEVSGLWVHRDWRRMGIATELFNRLKKHVPELQHSNVLTEEGEGFARSFFPEVAASTVNWYDRLVELTQRTRAAEKPSGRQPGEAVAHDGTPLSKTPSEIGFFLHEPDPAVRDQLIRANSIGLPHTEGRIPGEEGNPYTWKDFSRARGYSEEEIADLEAWYEMLQGVRAVDGTPKGVERFSDWIETADFDDLYDWAYRIRAIQEAEGIEPKVAGPGGGVIPARVVGPPVDPRQPRPVVWDRMALGDLQDVGQDEQKKARQMVKLLEQGKAPVEQKDPNRELAGAYGVRVDEDCRMVIYPHIDGSWHVLYIGPHDYIEAERRWADVYQTRNQRAARTAGKVTLYHGTIGEFAALIEDNGIAANDIGMVYATTDIERAEMWARTRAEAFGDEAVVVEFQVDEDDVTTAARDGEMAHWGDVPVEAITSIFYAEEGPTFEARTAKDTTGLWFAPYEERDTVRLEAYQGDRTNNGYMAGYIEISRSEEGTWSPGEVVGWYAMAEHPGLKEQLLEEAKKLWPELDVHVDETPEDNPPEDLEGDWSDLRPEPWQFDEDYGKAPEGWDPVAEEEHRQDSQTDDALKDLRKIRKRRKRWEKMLSWVKRASGVEDQNTMRVYEEFNERSRSGDVGQTFADLDAVRAYLTPLLEARIPEGFALHIDYEDEPLVAWSRYLRPEEVPTSYPEYQGQNVAVLYIGERMLDELTVVHEAAHIILQYNGMDDDHGPNFQAQLEELANSTGLAKTAGFDEHDSTELLIRWHQQIADAWGVEPPELVLDGDPPGEDGLSGTYLGDVITMYDYLGLSEDELADILAHEWGHHFDPTSRIHGDNWAGLAQECLDIIKPGAALNLGPWDRQPDTDFDVSTHCYACGERFPERAVELIRKERDSALSGEEYAELNNLTRKHESCFGRRAAAVLDFDALRRGDTDWCGADGGFPVEIGEGRTLWLFGDTFVGRMDPNTGALAPDWKIVHSSLVLQQGREWAVIMGGERGNRTEIIPGDDHTWYWPTAGVRADGKVWLFCWEVQTDPRLEGGVFDFQTVGTRIAEFELHESELNSQLEYVRLHEMPGSDAEHPYGASAVVRDGFVYAYGYAGSGDEHYVARTTDITDPEAWEYWTGALTDDWSRAAWDRAEPMEFEGPAPKGQLRVLSSGRLQAVSKLGMGSGVGLWSAEFPEGPWTYEEQVGSTTTTSHQLSYDAFIVGHGSDARLVYSVNTVDSERALRNAWQFGVKSSPVSLPHEGRMVPIQNVQPGDLVEWQGDTRRVRNVVQMGQTFNPDEGDDEDGITYWWYLQFEDGGASNHQPEGTSVVVARTAAQTCDWCTNQIEGEGYPSMRRGIGQVCEECHQQDLRNVERKQQDTERQRMDLVDFDFDVAEQADGYTYFHIGATDPYDNTRVSPGYLSGIVNPKTKTFNVKLLWINQGYRYRGAGSAVMDYVIDWCRQQGLRINHKERTTDGWGWWRDYAEDRGLAVEGPESLVHASVPPWLVNPRPSAESGYVNKAWLAPDGTWIPVKSEHATELPGVDADRPDMVSWESAVEEHMERGYLRAYVGMRSGGQEIGVEGVRVTEEQIAALREVADSLPGPSLQLFVSVAGVEDMAGNPDGFEGLLWQAVDSSRTAEIRDTTSPLDYGMAAPDRLAYHDPDSGELVSYLDYTLTPDAVWIHHLSTDSAHWGRGYARALVQELYDRYYDGKRYFEWGKVMHERAGTLVQDFEKRYPLTYYKNWWSSKRAAPAAI